MLFSYHVIKITPLIPLCDTDWEDFDNGRRKYEGVCINEPALYNVGVGNTDGKGR